MRRLSANEDVDTDEDCRYRAVINMSAISDSPVRSPPARGVVADQFPKKEGGDVSLANQFVYSSATTVTSDVQRNCDGQSPSRYPYVPVSGAGSRCDSARSRSNIGTTTTTCCGVTRDCGNNPTGQHNIITGAAGAGRSMRALYNSNRHALFERSVRAKWRSIKMLFVVVLEFFVCWTPVFVVQTWKIFDDVGASQSVSAGTMNLIHLLAFASSCTNPITYCFMSNRFRQCFIGVFGRCSCRSGSRRSGAAVEGRSWRCGMGEYSNRNRQQLSSPPHWESNRMPSPLRSRFDS